jgi:hypothetical protein
MQSGCEISFRHDAARYRRADLGPRPGLLPQHAAAAAAWRNLGAALLAGLLLLLLLPSVATAQVADKSAGAASPTGLNNTSDRGLALEEAERSYIAQIEHRALTLAKKGFPLITSAVKRSDAPALTRLFAPRFQAQVMDLRQGVAVRTDVLRHWRVRPEDTGGMRTLDAAGFAKHLLEQRQRFQQEPTVELKLVEFAPVTREDMDGRWRGTCKLQLAGRGPEGGPLEVFMELEFVCLRVADVETIQEDSGWIESMKLLEGFEATAAHDLLVDVAKERGIDAGRFWDNWKHPPAEGTVVSGGVFVEDFDGDGRLDILVADFNTLALFRARADGQFEDITVAAGLSPRAKRISNVAIADFDNDSHPDLLLEHRPFRNLGGARFQEVTSSSNLRVGNQRYVVGYTVTDFDKDGLADLYVARSWGPAGRNGKNSWLDGPGGPGNMLLRNKGDWQFEDVSKTANALAGRRSVFTTAWLDANTDGWPDVYVINEFGGGVLLVNQGDGTFKERFLTEAWNDFGSMGLAVADVNNDGHVDLYTANMYSKSGRRIVGNLASNAYAPDVMAKMKRFFPGSELYMNQGGLQFEAKGKAMGVRAVGWAYGPAFADLDNDGFLDLYATSGFVTIDNGEPDG